MAGFVRRFDFFPTLEVIRQIEGVILIDLAPPEPSTGVGSGAVMLVGEFEDGPFAEDTTIDNSILEIVGSQDLINKYGGFGFERDGVVAEDPVSRRHLAEDWNGNGNLKAFGLKAQRLFIARVDNSVGSISYTALSCISGKAGPYPLAVGQQFSATSETASPALSTAIAATPGTVTGTAGTFPTNFVGGETMGITLDSGNQVTVVFSALDQSNADIVSRINVTFGTAISVLNTGQVEIAGFVQGTDGSVALADTTTGVLAILGFTVGTTAGTGNVGNVNAVNADEVADIVNGTAAMASENIEAFVRFGALRICSSTAGGTILIASTTPTPPGMAEAIGFDPLDTTVDTAALGGGTIPAGSRVSDGGSDSWLTLQTLDIPAGEAGPFTVKVRASQDDGTVTAAPNAGAITTVIDQPEFAHVTVSNGSDFTTPLTEPALDAAYTAALEASLNDALVSKEANYVLLARRSDTVIRAAVTNANDAKAQGLFGRKVISGDLIGTDPTTVDSRLDALGRSDRLFYTAMGWRVFIPAIAERGTDGGVGFTANGVITVRPDGPLTSICAIRPPEENPGQSVNGLINQFFEVDTFGASANVELYTLLRAAGVVAPRRDNTVGSIYQSGVTTSQESGKKNIARRKMADFILDSYSGLLPQYVKKLNRQTERDNIYATIDGFLSLLQQPQNPELSRIEGYVIQDGEPPNSAALRALGVHIIITRVRTLASLDFIVVQAEIGENALLIQEVTAA